MSVAELESVLGRMREASAEGASVGVRLSTEQALSFRNAGNVPDENGRSLRLVLRVDDENPESLARKRALYEPDYHSAPAWRRPGSKPVNVVPLGRAAQSAREPGPWWEEPDVGALEEEWQREGTMRGVKVPADFRSFVHKTVLALEAAGRAVNATTIADSVARWLPPTDAAAIRTALLEANSKGAGQVESPPSG